LERAGTDAIVDAGRLGVTHAPTALLRQADLVLLVMGTSLPAVAAAKARLNLLREDLSVTGTATSVDGHLSSLGLLLVGEGRPYTAKEISAACGVPVVASLAWDPASAEVFAAGRDPLIGASTAPAGAQHPSGPSAPAWSSSANAVPVSPRQSRRRPAWPALPLVEAASDA
jgi:hypothetical protein